MHAHVGFYQVEPGTPIDSVPAVRDTLVAWLRDLPGLERGAAVITGAGSFVVLSCWETRAQADQAGASLSIWARDNLGAGTVVADHVGEVVLVRDAARDGHAPECAVVLTHSPKPGAPALEDRMRAEFIPIFERHPGFIAFTRVRADSGTLITLVEWDSREALAKAQPTLSRWGDEHVTPHMSDATARSGDVVWSFRRG